ncbi:MAG: hypothetical protein BGP12_14530 [Rhodospirillales bacterium 70-18]|nr:class I SAM-dependent methyltransferase [Rhodospirillales bacterium]OJY67347.1 MAG: hypothetical protein BGP12_14530 [Rhodospirillales bacterium 70-18]
MSDFSADELQALVAHVGDIWVPTHPYYRRAEDDMDRAWATAIQPFIAGCDFTATVDLAAGHGRNSTKLADLATRLTIIDIQPGNIEICRARFAGRPHVTCHVGSGYDLRPLEDASQTLIYCFDAMVHFDRHVVRAYLRDAQRVLVPGGRAFLHHSNHTGGEEWLRAPHARNFMSSDLFAAYARAEGLTVLNQHVISWGKAAELDCFSLVEKPTRSGKPAG